MLGLFGKKASSLLGIDITSTSVRLVELKKLGRRLRLQAYAVEPLPANAVVEGSLVDLEAVGQALGRALARAGTTSRRAAVAVPGSAVITKHIEMPAGLMDEEMEARITAEADQYIPYALEEVAIDFQVQGPSAHGKGRVDVLLAACRKEAVEEREAALALAGLAAGVVDIDAHALERACSLLDPQQAGESLAGVLALVDIGATTTTLTVLQGTRVIHSREQLFGARQLSDDLHRHYGLSVAQAERALSQEGRPDDGLAGLLQSFLEATAQQVERSLHLYSASPKIDSILLAGTVASLRGLVERVGERLDKTTQLANPFAGMELGKSIDGASLATDAPALLVASGLALRSFD
ncbi:Cell division protein FtsA [compost metagenome]